MLAKLLKQFKSNKTHYDNQLVEEQIPEQPSSPLFESTDLNIVTLTEQKISTSNSYHEKTRQLLQAQFDNPPTPPVIKLVPQEYAGPFLVDKPLILDGQGATLWSLTGPVLQVNSPTLIIKNLNIEVTGESFNQAEEECAICVNPATVIHLEEVQVRGQVIGITGEIGEWRYPYSLHLGKLAQQTRHHFLFRITVPTPCHLESAIAGIHLSPTQLAPGYHDVSILIEPLAHNTSLYGSLYIKTRQLNRRIYLTAHISANASSTSTPPQSPTVLMPPDWKLSPTVPSPMKLSVKQPLSSPRGSGAHSELVKPVDAKTHLQRLEKSVFFTKTTRKTGAPPITKNRPHIDQATDNIFIKITLQK